MYIFLLLTYFHGPLRQRATVYNVHECRKTFFTFNPTQLYLVNVVLRLRALQPYQKFPKITKPYPILITCLLWPKNGFILTLCV